MSYKIITPEYVYGNQGQVLVNPSKYVYRQKNIEGGATIQHLSVPLALYSFHQHDDVNETHLHMNGGGRMLPFEPISTEVFDVFFMKTVHESTVRVERSQFKQSRKTRKQK